MVIRLRFSFLVKSRKMLSNAYCTTAASGLRDKALKWYYLVCLQGVLAASKIAGLLFCQRVLSRASTVERRKATTAKETLYS